MKDFKKIINITQTRNADNHTIQKNDISSLELMENASLAFVKALEKKDILSKKIMVICGVGNNGGDGFAVCRLLRERGISATAVLIKFKDTLAKDCNANLKKINDAIILNPESQLPDFSNTDIIIDAIFGTGINKPVRGFAANIIEAINNSGKTVYSLDVPSGLICDEIFNFEHIVKSDFVISFQRPKLAFFFPENRSYIENWEVVDIGLDEAFIQEQEIDKFVLDATILNFVSWRSSRETQRLQCINCFGYY